MTLQPGEDLYTLIMTALEETGFTFLYKEELDNSVLKTKGALNINAEGLVLNYVDKPEDNKLGLYNAFWCAFGFRRRTFDQCMNFMEKSTLKLKTNEKEIQSTPIYGSKAIKVKDYVDLGTWSEIRRLLLNYEKNYK